MKLTLLTSSLLAITNGALTAAHPEHHPPQADRVCHQFKVPVSATGVNAQYNLKRVDNDIEVSNWVSEFDRWSAPLPPTLITDNITIAGTYMIHAQLCTPLSSATNKKHVLQIATHGLVYDKRYWDAEVETSTNSYVSAAVKAGYSILTYDRLGAGLSDKPDAYTVVQGPLQLGILHQLTLMARNGDLFKVAKTQNPVEPEIRQMQKPSKIVHVGHSYGSFITAALLSGYGNISDGAIFTGYIPNKEASNTKVGPFEFQLARTYSPPRFADRPSGYIVPGSRSSIQQTFFAGLPSDLVGGFTEEMLTFGDAIKQPVTVAEFASVSALNLGRAPQFRGPVQFMEGEFDRIICGGDCKNTYDMATLHAIYPGATAIEVHIQPNTGHGLTLHRNATAGYLATREFLRANGL